MLVCVHCTIAVSDVFHCSLNCAQSFLYFYDFAILNIYVCIYIYSVYTNINWLRVRLESNIYNLQAIYSSPLPSPVLQPYPSQEDLHFNLQYSSIFSYTRGIPPVSNILLYPQDASSLKYSLIPVGYPHSPMLSYTRGIPPFFNIYLYPWDTSILQYSPVAVSYLHSPILPYSRGMSPIFSQSLEYIFIYLSLGIYETNITYFMVCVQSAIYVLRKFLSY